MCGDGRVWCAGGDSRDWCEVGGDGRGRCNS